MDPVALIGSAAASPHLSDVAISADGSLAVAWVDTADYLTRVAMRDAAGGRWHAPQTLNGYQLELAGSAGSEFVAVLLEDAAQQLFVATGTPGTGLGASEQLSESGRTVSVPELVTNERGDALVTWNPGQPGFMTMGDAIAVAVREPGGGWGVELSLDRSGNSAMLPSVALNAAGDAVVVWHGPGIRSSFRPARGSFGEMSGADIRPHHSAHMPIALDGAGTAVMPADPTDDPNAWQGGLVVRWRDGAFGEPLALGPLAAHTSVTDLQVRSDGTGHVAWIEYLADGRHRAWITALRTLKPPPRPPEPSGPETTARRAEPLRIDLSHLPRRVTRRTLGRGLKVTLGASAASKVELRLTGAGRRSRLVAERQLTMAGGRRVVRLRVHRRRLAALRRGTRLDLRAQAVGEGSATATARRRLRLR